MYRSESFLLGLSLALGFWTVISLICPSFLVSGPASAGLFICLALRAASNRGAERPYKEGAERPCLRSQRAQSALFFFGCAEGAERRRRKYFGSKLAFILGFARITRSD